MVAIISDFSSNIYFNQQHFKSTILDISETRRSIEKKRKERKGKRKEKKGKKRGQNKTKQRKKNGAKKYTDRIFTKVNAKD